MQPSNLERTQFEVDHPEQHEAAQKHFLVLLWHSPAQSDQMNYDTPEAYQHTEVPPRYHFHT